MRRVRNPKINFPQGHNRFPVPALTTPQVLLVMKPVNSGSSPRNGTRLSAADSSASAPLKLNDSATHSDRHGFRAILRSHLLADVPQVHFDGPFGNGQLLSDIAVPLPRSD